VFISHHRDADEITRHAEPRSPSLLPGCARPCHLDDCKSQEFLKCLDRSVCDAVAQGPIATNPADKARPPAARQARAPEICPWTAAQLSTFLRWADEHGRTDATAWRVLAFTGMRRGEALALPWCDLDMDEARLSVRRSVGLVRTKGEGAEFVEGPTKSGRDRVVDLDPQTVAALRAWRLSRAGIDLRLARDDALIFGDLEGRHQHPERFTRRFTRSLALARRGLSADALPTARLMIYDTRTRPCCSKHQIGITHPVSAKSHWWDLSPTRGDSKQARAGGVSGEGSRTPTLPIPAQ
jgi:hypothetical protein